MAGGVALNCVANGKVIDAGIFDEVWVQPAAGDAGEPSAPPRPSRPSGAPAATTSVRGTTR